MSNKTDHIIHKFKGRRQTQRVSYNRKNFKVIGPDATKGKLLIKESMHYKNWPLVYKCLQLKSARKISSICFFNSNDIVKLLGTNNSDEFTNIRSLWTIFINNYDVMLCVFFLIFINLSRLCSMNNNSKLFFSLALNFLFILINQEFELSEFK